MKPSNSKANLSLRIFFSNEIPSVIPDFTIVSWFTDCNVISPEGSKYLYSIPGLIYPGFMAFIHSYLIAESAAVLLDNFPGSKLFALTIPDLFIANGALYTGDASEGSLLSVVYLITILL